jgi:hypothetical protein
MKATDKPEISEQWWANEKPSDFQGGKDLAKALADARKVLDHAKKGDVKSLDAGVKELGRLRQVVHKTIRKECDRKKDKDLIAVLENYNRVITDRVKQLYKDGAHRPDSEEISASAGRLSN